MKDNQLLQLAQQRRQEIEHYWPENVFLPLEEWYAALASESLDPADIVRIGELAVTGPHRYTRSVYRFDPTLQESLMSTQLSGDLPTDLLLRLPEWTVYIDIDNGVYVSLDCLSDTNSEEYTKFELQMSVNGLPFVLPIGPWGVEEGLRLMYENCVRRFGDLRVNEVRHFLEVGSEAFRRYLPLIMYICSDGVEYSDSARPAYPTPTRTRRDGWKLFPAKRDRVWKLGHKTGEAIRAGRRTPGQGRKGPAPHIRRAHWHTLRNGKVKFFPPIPVAQHNHDGI